MLLYFQTVQGRAALLQGLPLVPPSLDAQSPSVLQMANDKGE